MELHEAIRRRTMVRSFSSERVDPRVVDCLLRARAAGPDRRQHGGHRLGRPRGPEQTGAYWEVTTDEAWRPANPARFEGLRRAPVVLLAYASPVGLRRPLRRARQGRTAGSAAAAERWPVPYWFGDAAFGVMTVLLGAVDAGLGACILGNFRGEAAAGRTLEVPDVWRLFAAVLWASPTDELTGPFRSIARSPMRRNVCIGAGGSATVESTGQLDVRRTLSGHAGALTEPAHVLVHECELDPVLAGFLGTLHAPWAAGSSRPDERQR